MFVPFIFLFFLCLNYAVFLLVTRRTEARSARLQQRVAEALRDSADPEHPDLQLLRRESISSIPALNRLLAPLSVTRKLQTMISQSDLNLTVGGLLLFCLVAGSMAALAAYTLVSSSVIVFVFGALAVAMPVAYVSYVRQRRLRKFLELLPDGLDLMGRSLAVGHAFTEALHQVGSEMPDPVGAEFRLTYEEQKLGLPLKLALENMTERVPSLDLRLCVTAILIQRETGGNLAEILEKVSTTIRERFRLAEDFRTLTTASRGSGWILSVLPILIIMLMYWMAPEYVGILFSDPRGHYILGLIVVMLVLGIFTIRRILAIKV